MNWAFESFWDFLQMGKHGGFVWSCVVLTVLAFILLFAIERAQYCFLKRAMAQQPAAQPQRVSQ